MAVHGSTLQRTHANVPRPAAAAAPLAAIAVLALLLDAAPDIPWESGVVAAGLFGVAALVRLVERTRELARLRTLADRIILSSSAVASPLVSWRTAELTSPARRRSLAGQTQRLVRDLETRTLPGAVPLRRAAVRPHAAGLQELAVLLDGDDAVSARGVLLAERLLSDPASPLFDPDAGSVERPLRTVLRALREGA